MEVKIWKFSVTDRQVDIAVNYTGRYPKFYYNVMLFVGSKTLGTLAEFDWLVITY